MEEMCKKGIYQQRKALLHDSGKTYFTKKTERKFLFVLTFIMLLLGVLAKLGLL